jgi:hypothetical protein
MEDRRLFKGNKGIKPFSSDAKWMLKMQEVGRGVEIDVQAWILTLLLQAQHMLRLEVQVVVECVL